MGRSWVQISAATDSLSKMDTSLCSSYHDEKLRNVTYPDSDGRWL